MRTPVILRHAFLAGLLLLVLGARPAGAQVYWTDWLSAAPGTVAGQINVFSQSIGVTYAGPYDFAQTSPGDFPYWTTDTDPGTYPDGPTTPDLVALNVAGTHTLTFGTAVVDPYLAILSMGRPQLPVSYAFSDPFTVVSEGKGYWGDGTYAVSGNTLIGNEMHGVVRFSGTFTQLTWQSTPNEFWHGITVGVAGAAPSSAVPEPSTVLLLGTGLLGMGLAARRRRHLGEGTSSDG